MANSVGFLFAEATKIDGKDIRSWILRICGNKEVMNGGAEKRGRRGVW